MNRLFLLLYSMLFCGLISCSGSNKSTETVKAIEKTDCCKLDAKNTYEVYIPARNNTTDKLPLLVIIDAHGNGKFALNNFKQGANQYPTILIASNLIKNGFDGIKSAIETLIDDVHQKYPTNELIFMTGFSGGARMVLEFAQTHQLNGLIMCGALAGTDKIQAVRCPVISISGMDDFNFMETAQYLFNEQSTPANLKIELINASHTWPDSLMLTNALGFLSFTGQGGDIAFRNESLFKKYCLHQQERINTLKQQGDWLNAAVVARNMATTEPFNSDTTFTSAYRTLKTQPDYLSQLNRLGKCLQFEISVRQSYVDAFQTKDSLWWNNEIRKTEEKIKTEQDSFTKDMYRRIKGFWGIASYTFCKQAIMQQQTGTLKNILAIYRMLEPENPDMFYFSAFPYFWAGNNETTILQLKKAIQAGFSDRKQLQRDFPESITSKL